MPARKNSPNGTTFRSTKKTTKKPPKSKTVIVQDTTKRRMPPTGRKANLSVKSLTPQTPESEIGRKRKTQTTSVTDKLLDLENSTNNENAPKDALSPEIREGGQSHSDIAKALGMDLPIRTIPTTSTPIPRADPTILTQELANIEELASIKWSKYIPASKIPHPKQIAGMMMVNEKELLYGGALGGGKLLYDDGDILTPFGFIKGEQLTIGQNVCNPDGSICQVIQLHPRQQLQVWRVYFNDDTYTDVAREHLWNAWSVGRATKRNGSRLTGSNSTKVYETVELKRMVDEGQTVRIPLCNAQAFNMPSRGELLDPYMFGAWLGDGHVSNCKVVGFTTADISHFRSYLEEGTWHKNPNNMAGTFAMTGSTRVKWFSFLVQEGLSTAKAASKFVPLKYKLGTLSNRLAILQGLMDTDGYIDSRGQCYYTSISEQLIKDVAFIARSLGCYVKITSRIPKYTYKGEKLEGQLAYTAYIKHPNDLSLFRLKKKSDRVCSKQFEPSKQIIRIRRLPEKRIGRCITVNHPNGLYITNDFIVTHNSEWLAMEALRFCDLPGFAAIIFRRQLTDLSMPGALIDRIGSWLAPHKESGMCRYSGEQHTWSFRTFWPGTDIPGPEAKLQFGYIGGAEIRERYQSAEYSLVCFDELGQWPDDQDYVFMHTRIRKNVCNIHGKDKDENPIYHPTCPQCQVLSQIPLRMRSASNPGMAWVKKRWGIKPDPTLYKTPRQALIAIDEGKKVKWVGTSPDAKFLPAYLWDNPSLNYKEYIKMLKELPEEKRSQLQDGNWESRCDSRFKRKWQQFVQLDLPEPYLTERWDEEAIKYFQGKNFREGSYSKVVIDGHGNILIQDAISFKTLDRIFTTADIAVSVSAGPVDEQLKKKSSSTVISTWGITKYQELLWLHSVKIKAEIPDVVSTIIDLNTVWHPTMNKIEANGVGIGVAQYVERAGYPVSKNMKKTDKLENSLCAQIIMKNGRVLFPINALWLEDAEDDIFQWTGVPTEPDDRIDTLSDAANELGPQVAREISNRQATAQSRPRCIGTIGSSQLRGPTNTFGKRFY